MITTILKIIGAFALVMLTIVAFFGLFAAATRILCWIFKKLFDD